MFAIGLKILSKADLKELFPEAAIKMVPIPVAAPIISPSLAQRGMFEINLERVPSGLEAKRLLKFLVT
ncbi:MAG: hypothetical protein DRJ03_24965 [Chloroflexi bacterium]|nr:MAG: hypothetical protein DRJ03_24965 [Chloroflexota bacterium]